MANAMGTQLSIQEVEQALTRKIVELNAEMQAKLDQVTACLAELQTLHTNHSTKHQHNNHEEVGLAEEKTRVQLDRAHIFSKWKRDAQKDKHKSEQLPRPVHV
ncbi:hypothetical protein E2542_SST30597 [Spatholobus suberectus]|nr:hypothetical protein E2542_SST30597 [Spatholobus suberectus]